MHGRRQSALPQAFDDTNSVTTPEQRLMFAVILAAINDAIGKSPLPETSDRRAMSMRQARNWFDRADHDFQAVCLSAGLNPMAVRSAALDYVRAQTETPAEKQCRFAAIPGLTIEALASKAGVTPASARRVLEGTGFPRPKTRAKVEAALAELSRTALAA